MYSGERSSINESDLDKELAKLKEKMAQEDGAGKKIAQPEAPSSATSAKPRTEEEARQRLAALEEEIKTGVPADVKPGQEMSDEEVRKRLAELSQEVKSGKKPSQSGKPGKTIGQPGDSLLMDLAQKGRQQIGETGKRIKELARMNRETKDLLDKTKKKK